MAKIKHCCMCGCMYEQADCPNCNKVSDKARIAELEAEQEKDHAEINLKADFIDATLNQLATAEARIAELEVALREALKRGAVMADSIEYGLLGWSDAVTQWDNFCAELGEKKT